MPHSDFLHLHVHTQYSLLDGACRIPELLKLAKEFNMDSLAITDHGNMFGAVEFYMSAQKAGIKPIIGCEMYVAPGSRHDKSAGGIEDAANHLILLARDETGYQNLMKLVSAAYLEGFYYRPRIDKEILSAHAKGLIGMSACLKGEVPSLILQKRMNDALKAADTYATILGRKNFYLELQANSIPEQKVVNEGLLKIAGQLDLPVVATNDVHYLAEPHAASHEALLCIQTQSTLEDPNRMKFQTNEFYFRSPSEMKALFKECPQAIANTLEIAERCNLELDFGQVHLPKYEPPVGMNKEDYLRTLCEEGLKERYGSAISEEIRSRLEHELEIITHMGYVSYFLIVWDFIHYAKSKGIPVGPGRGSAAGSLVSYLLGITDLDPLAYGLLFERFLNPERQGLPDIDIDFCYERRQEVIDYVTQKYGRENVAQIITFGTMQARAVVRDVGRVMGMEYAEVDRIAKMIPPDPNITLRDALNSETEMKQLYQSDPRVKRLIDTGLTLEGLNRHASVHAAGVVIADKPLDNYMPLFKSGDSQVTSGYAMGHLEKIGMLKMDFLGLRTLTVIDQALKLIRQTRGVDIDFRTMPMSDEATYALLGSAHTHGVFQLESSGMRDLLRKLNPNRFEDLIALLALYRPGPIGSGMLDDFIQRKHGRVPIKYDHKKLETVLRETYGIILYQEQIMQIASVLADFSMAEADLLRRAMSKKIPEVMERQRSKFMEGCARNKINASVAAKIFSLIEYFSGYGFNKCVVGDTEILDADTGRYVTVEQLYKHPDRMRSTFSCSDKMRIGPGSIKGVFYNGIKTVYTLRTRLGHEIRATANHPFLTMHGWRHLGDLRPGDRLAAARSVPLLNATTLEEHKLVTLGWILSEGNTCHPSGVYFYNNLREQVDDFVRHAEQFDNTVTRVTMRRDRYEVYAGTGVDTRFAKGEVPWNKPMVTSGTVAVIQQKRSQRCGLRIWIEQLELDYKKAGEKFIPEQIFTLHRDNIALFIGRLWSGDGFIFGPGASIPFYATSSQKLARQLQGLLLRFGIVSRLDKKLFKYTYQERQREKEGYTLYLWGTASVKSFIHHICPFIVGRSAQVAGLKNYYEGVPVNAESLDTIPYEIRQVVREEKDRFGLTWKELGERSGVCMRDFYGAGKHSKQGFRRHTIHLLAQYLESEKLYAYIESDLVWDRVVSVEYAGDQPTYDLEIEATHNFVANGLIVHNSHSTAYALISYRTAYLKANYPVEFMTALLTSERDNTDKIVEYVNEAQRMGISVLPPNINTSDVLFTVAGDKRIAFGLLAVKNVGTGAAEAIVQNRRQQKYASLEDLCQRVDLRQVNKKVLESLIKCGALDDFKMPRAQMVASLESLLNASARMQREKATGQVSFFDGDLGEKAGFKASSLTLPDIKEWPETQLLSFEKDILGFYVSGHPLARFAKQLERFASTSMKTLSAHQDDDEVKIVGLIAKVKNAVTRARQEKMAILKVEDLDGAVEVLVFPKAYQKVARYVQAGSVVLLTGRLNLKEDQPKIIANDLLPFEEAYKLITGISIDVSGIKENLFETLKEVFLAHHGDTPVYLHLATPQKSRVQLVVGQGFYVTPSEKLINRISELLDEERVSLVL